MTEALITPELLQWARVRSQYSLATLAEKCKVKLERLRDWEEGTKKPTFNQAQKLAKQLHIPFGFLFLSSPPKVKADLPDLRTLPEARPLSNNFLDVYTSAKRKQEWYREHLKREGTEPIKLGQFTLDHNPQSVAADMADFLGINKGFRKHSRNWESYLLKLARQAESKGIHVLRSGMVANDSTRILDVEEFRGFAINDDFAPLIFINGRDAKAAQIFTFAHEMAHLWLGQDGVSNPQMNHTPGLQIERFCDKVAAEFLVPFKEFEEYQPRSVPVEDHIKDLTSHFKVSSLVILRRAFDLSYMDRETFSQCYAREIRFIKTRTLRKDDGSSGNFYPAFENRNGRNMTPAIVAAAISGRLLIRDAVQMLGVKKFSTLEAYHEFWKKAHS